MSKNLNYRKPRGRKPIYRQYGVSGRTPKDLVDKRKELEERKFQLELDQISNDHVRSLND